MEVVTNSSNQAFGHPLRHQVSRPTFSPKDSENSPLRAVPLGLQGMLKTSTETGDIGQFSIKPPRVPHHPAALPSPRGRVAMNNVKVFPEHQMEHYQNFHPITDDRRRLPSYSLAPGAASDTVSLCSQMSTPSSCRPFKDVEYRASSMTASSYSPFGISNNHNSYASLRSQPEIITQRPRSPYLYPARLKRPGFRPSSPLLSDGGVDYSRRAEIDRVLVPPSAPYMNGGRSTSPSSFYAHKRVPPPLSIRTDVNRSNPSPRHPQSPNRNQNWQTQAGNEDSFRDWARRNDVAGRKDVSPAKSNHSYASTVYRSGPPGSTITTPGRLHAPSPLYYDYTEEFETEDLSERAREDALPPFQLEKTIHEDRPLSTGWDSLETLEVKGEQPRINPGRSIRSSVGELVIDSEGNSLRGSPAISLVPSPVDGQRVQSVASGAGDSLENLVRMYENETDNNEDSDADESPKRSFPLNNYQFPQLSIPTIAELPGDPQLMKSTSGPLPEFDLAGESLTDRSSDYSLSSNLPMNFPKPPTPLPPIPLLVDKAKVDRSGKEIHLNKKLPVKPPDEPSVIQDPEILAARATNPVNQIENKGERGPKHKRSASTQSGYRSSKFLSVDPGLEDLAQLVSTFEAAKARGEFGWSINGHQEPTRLARSNMHSGSNTQRTLKQHRSDSNLSNGYQEPMKPAREILQATTNIRTPMFAPKPISPARVAKLKTTVPHLMKALPALPRPDSIRAISPSSSLPRSIAEFPGFCFSPLLKSTSTPPVELDSQAVHELPAMPRQPPKLKIRLRRSELTTAPTTSETPRPWNLEESYPWSGEPVFKLGSAAGPQQPTNQLRKAPKFKLKVSRPSVSSFETIQVNRDAVEGRESLGLENPTDLFTPPSRQYGIHALFSKVSRHFSHTKKAGVAKSISMVNVNSGGQVHRTVGSSDRGSSLDLGVPQLQIPLSTGEARSFFSDDSSQIQESTSLRRRITNLRARLPTPYTSRTSTMATRSFDDIVYRQRSLRSANVLGRNDFRVEDEIVSRSEIVTTENHRQKLKNRLTGWLGRAKVLMTGYIRPRSHGTR